MILEGHGFSVEVEMGEYNMVHEGERRHYPDAEGPVY